MTKTKFDPSCYRCSMGDPCGGHHGTATEHFGQTPRLSKRRRRAWLDLSDLNTPIEAASIRMHREIQRDGDRVTNVKVGLTCGDCNQVVLEHLDELSDQAAFDQFLRDLVDHALLTGCGLRRNEETAP